MNSLITAALVITGLGLGAGVPEAAGAEATLNMAAGMLSPADAATDCAALDGYRIPAASIGLPTMGAVVSSTQMVAPDKATRSPEFCLIRGSIAPVDSTARAINFQINLPTQWNLKTLQEGGGGLDGIVVTGLDNIPNTFGTGVPAGPLPALSRGYVTFGSDAGTAPDGSALVNDEVLANYEGAAVKKTRDTGIDIVARYYGRQPQQQYFAGGSKGGHEALVAAQRYPADYTGVIANYPANQIAAMAITWDHMKQLAYQREGGFLNAAKQQLLRKAIYDSCDSLDGAQDGVVSNTRGCADQFDVRDLLCPNGADTGDSCLSETQVGTLTGAANPYRFDFQLANGITTLGGFPVLTGADIGPRQQDSWWLNSTDTDNSVINFLSSRLIRYAIERNPDANLDGWDYRDWEPRLKQLSREFDATTPDLDRFFARGGKLILVQGDDDVLVPEHSTSAYFEALMGRYGRSLHNYARYYRQPGYGHAQGTFDLSFDSLGALETWTTTGVAPLTPTAVDINTGRTMPLCQYPSWPRYHGSGDTTKATSYTCVTGNRPASTAISVSLSRRSQRYGEFKSGPKATVNVTGDGTPGQTDQTGEYGAAGVAGTVIITDAGAPVGSAQLTHGAVTIPLPARLAAGSHLLRIAYTPTVSSYTAPAITTTSVKISKAVPKLTVARAHRGKNGRARLIVRVSARHLRPSGPITVRAQGMKRILRVHLRDGMAIVTLPRLGAGPRSVTVRYRGSSNIRRASVSKTINLAVG